MPRSMPTTALTKPCEHCGELMRGMPARLAKRRFCTQACAGQARRKKRKVQWVKITCKHCRRSFEVTPAWARNGRRKYCSRACHAKANLSRLGKRHTKASRKKMADAATGKFLRENSSQWKGGRYKDRNGYLHVMIEVLPEPLRPFARKMVKGKYVLEHRAVAAMTLGRPLARTEIVHHRNGIKDDNRPRNLEVTDRRDHSKDHRKVERELVRIRAENKRLRAQVRALKLSVN